MPELRVPSLADDVVRLRPWRETDVPAQLNAFSDPFFQCFSDWAPHTEAEARACLVAHEQARQRGEQIEFALVEPYDENVVLGGGSLNSVSLEQGRAAIGYWLAPHGALPSAAGSPVRASALAYLVQGHAARHGHLQLAARRAAIDQSLAALLACAFHARRSALRAATG